MLRLALVLTLLPTLAVADVTGPAHVIDGESIENSADNISIPRKSFPDFSWSSDARMCRSLRRR